jgi:phage baseplate assembly protein W
MTNDCYLIPPSFGDLARHLGDDGRKPVAKLPVLASIEQHIALYLGTKPGEYHYDPAYGCLLHNYDFSQLTQMPKKEELKRSIEGYLKNFDPRVALVSLQLNVYDSVEQPVDGRPGRSSRRTQVTVNCRLKNTGEVLPEMKFEVVRYS